MSVIKHDKVVIGNTIEALLYAFYHDCYLIPNNQDRPDHFKFISEQIGEQIGLEDPIRLFNGVEEVTLGFFELDLWKRLAINLSLVGKVYPPSHIGSIRLEEGRVRIIATSPYITTVKYNELFIFNEEGVQGLPAPKKKNKERLRILDWLDIRKTETHPLEYIKTDEEIMNEMFFYPSDRRDGFNPRFKDCCLISYIDADKLQEFEYSDTYIRIKAQDKFKEIGLKGNVHDRDPKRAFKKRRRIIQATTSIRDVVKMTRHHYEDYDDIRFMSATLNEVIDGVRQKKVFGWNSPSGRPKIRF